MTLHHRHVNVPFGLQLAWAPRKRSRVMVRGIEGVEVPKVRKIGDAHGSVSAAKRGSGNGQNVDIGSSSDGPLARAAHKRA